MSAADPKHRRPNFEVIPVYRPDPARVAKALVELATANLAREAVAIPTTPTSTAPAPPAAEQARKDEAAS